MSIITLVKKKLRDLRNLGVFMGFRWAPKNLGENMMLKDLASH